MKDDKLRELTEAIVKAVPQIYERPKIFCEACDDWSYRDLSIRLEDVLRALHTLGKSVRVWDDGEFQVPREENENEELTERFWLLGAPLSQQSDETIAFLHTLLHGN